MLLAVALQESPPRIKLKGNGDVDGCPQNSYYYASVPIEVKELLENVKDVTAEFTVPPPAPQLAYAPWSPVVRAEQVVIGELS